MSETAQQQIDEETPLAERICARCAHSRNSVGQLFENHDRAFCAHPSIRSDDGAPVPCESQTFGTGSAMLQHCGVEHLLFEPRP